MLYLPFFLSFRYFEICTGPEGSSSPLDFFSFFLLFLFSFFPFFLLCFSLFLFFDALLDLLGESLLLELLLLLREDEQDEEDEDEDDDDDEQDDEEEEDDDELDDEDDLLRLRFRLRWSLPLLLDRFRSSSRVLDSLLVLGSFDDMVNVN